LHNRPEVLVIIAELYFDETELSQIAGLLELVHDLIRELGISLDRDQMEVFELCRNWLVE